MEEKLLYRIHVRGRVQGVGFRWSAAMEAANRGIKGFIRNQSDGCVYIEAEGYREQLDAFIEWCRKGPGLSRVKSVSVEQGPPENFEEFRIEH